MPAADSLAAWLLAVLILAAMTGLKIGLDRAAGSPAPPFITYYPAVVAAALVGGPRIGLAAAAATLALAWLLFMRPFTDLPAEAPLRIATMAFYAGSVLFVGWAVGIARVSLDKARANELQRDQAARESVHRIKNLLAVVQALSSKISREVQTSEDYRTLLHARIAALDTAQSLLLRREWTEVDLGETLDAALAPFLPNPGLTLKRGPSVAIPARYVSGLCMALYELCTNAMKYGALREGRGPVTLSWTVEDNQVKLEWLEETPTAASREEGLGTRLIRLALSDERNTSVEYKLEPDRVYACFRWPQ